MERHICRRQTARRAWREKRVRICAVQIQGRWCGRARAEELVGGARLRAERTEGIREGWRPFRRVIERHPVVAATGCEYPSRVRFDHVLGEQASDADVISTRGL